MTPAHPRIGTAGWAIPASAREGFPAEGSSLERYAARFNAVEINSSFHRPHRPATYERWAASVGADFRFAVKLPKTISHERRLADCADPLARFADEVVGLGDKRGPLLLQLPPSFAFDAALTARFLDQIARTLPGPLACEPRHPSWFGVEADALLSGHGVARVAADPARVPEAAHPGGASTLRYFRLHGSPVLYRSAYDDAVAGHAAAVRANPGETWVIYDNTMFGAATHDALRLADLLNRSAAPCPTGCER